MGSEDEWNDEETAELRVACFMGLVSFPSSRIEVLRIAPRHSKHLMNAAARALIQSATVTDTPLSDAGLDGTGQVIQVRKRIFDQLRGFHLLSINMTPVFSIAAQPYLHIEIDEVQSTFS